MAIGLATGARDASCDSIVDLLDAGTGNPEVRVYDGSRPASPNDGIGGVTLLVTFTLDGTAAFGASSSGTATLASTPISETAVATGTAAWFRAVDRDAATIFDGDVGTSGSDMNLNTTSITNGGTVELTSGTFSMPEGG